MIVYLKIIYNACSNVETGNLIQVWARISMFYTQSAG